MTIATLTPASIEFGPCNVTFGGVELGSSKGGVTFTYTPTFLDLTVDQSTMPVDARLMSEVAVVSFPMTELNLDKLTTVMATGTYTLDSGNSKKKIEVGGASITSATLAELIIYPIADGSATQSTDANEKVTIYKTLAKHTLVKGYNRDGERVTTVEFHAYRDATKAAGKQFFLLGDSTATA